MSKFQILKKAGPDRKSRSKKPAQAKINKPCLLSNFYQGG